MKDWFQNFDDDFWLLDNEMPEKESAFIKRALRLRKGQSVLDAPCGGGRTSLSLAKLGVNVTGIDLRKQFVSRARRGFRREGLVGSFHAIDMRHIELDNEFSAVVNWHGSFGYFSDEDNIDVLRRFVLALRPGGRVLIDQSNREFLLRHFVKERRIADRKSIQRKKSSGNLIIRNRWNSRVERVESTWTIERDGKKVKNPLSIRLYTPGQFEEIFRKAGLAMEATYGSWEGGDYHRSSRRLVVLGRKL